MHTRAIVEIVIPYYGHRSLLEEAVFSVRAQSCDDWRLLVVEDGDQGFGVEDWLSGMADERIRHVLNPVNMGLSGNFQRCLDLASAEFVTFLGCDDRLLPDYVDVVLRRLHDEPTVAAFLPGVRIIDEHGRVHHPLADRIKSRLRPRGGTMAKGQSALSRLCVGNWTYFPATCWRKSAIQPYGFDPDQRITLDLQLLADVLLDDHVVVVGDEVVFEYRRHRDSASSQALGDATRLQEEHELLRDLARRARERGWWRAALWARARPTSRLHALTQVTSPARAEALRHAFGP